MENEVILIRRVQRNQRKGDSSLLRQFMSRILFPKPSVTQARGTDVSGPIRAQGSPTSRSQQNPGNEVGEYFEQEMFSLLCSLPTSMSALLSCFISFGLHV